MEIRLPRKKNIFRLNDDFASIDTIDQYSRIVYRLNFFADVANAIANDAVRIKISAYSSNPLQKSPLFEGATTAADVVNGLRNRSSRQKESAARRHSETLASIYADISSAIDNETAAAIKKNIGIAPTAIGKRTVVVAVKQEKINKEKLQTAPRLAISTLDKKKNLTSYSSKRNAIRSILKDGLDPSVVGDVKFPLIPPRRSLQGTGVQGRSTIDRGAHIYDRRKTKARNGHVNTQIGPSQIRAQTTDMSPSRDMKKFERSNEVRHIRDKLSHDYTTRERRPAFSPQKTKVIIKKIDAVWKGYSDELAIGKAKLYGISTVYFLFELIDKTDRVIDQIVRTVNHKDLLDEYFRPNVPPTVYAKATRLGINTVQLSQRDPVGTSILLFRKQLNPASPSYAEKYVLISSFENTVDEEAVTFVDYVNNTVATIYRVLAVGPHGGKSRTFTNTIVRPLRNAGSKSLNPSTTLSHISLFAETRGDFVRIRVSNIPEGPCGLYVVATDHSTNQSEIIGASEEQKTQVISEQTTELFFDHITVRPNRLYNYNCHMIYPMGDKRTSRISVTHYFIQNFERENLTIAVGSPGVNVTETGEIVTTFSIDAGFTSQGLNALIVSLQDAGVRSEFTTLIQQNRGSLDSLLGILLERQDNITGETETYGVISLDESRNYVDNSASRIQAGVMNPLPGRTYKYIATVLVRDPSTLFTQASNIKIDIVTGKKYKQLAGKFLSPITLREGTLPSTSKALGISGVSGITMKNPFLQGITAISQAFSVTIPSQRTRVENLSASRIAAGDIVLRWSISGAPEEIDHFIILAEHEGIKSTLGTSHCLGGSGEYEYIDKELSHEVGITQYSIVPVFGDYTYGTESNQVSVFATSNYPNFIIRA